MATVRFPDGTRIRASSIADRRVDDPERKFGLYLDATWEPTWPATVIAWEDFGLPTNPELAAQQIVEAFGRARGGELVEVGCLGGSGRTGTVLACMAVLAGVPQAEAVAWVRANYRPQAVETADQEAWVRWFADWVDAGKRLGLGDLHAPIGDAVARPRLGCLDDPACQDVGFVLIVGDVLGVDVDPYLVQRRLGALADLMAILGNDRDLAHLGQQRLCELVDLGRRCDPAGEDPEVDANFEPGRFGLTLVERELRFGAHRTVVARARET